MSQTEDVVVVNGVVRTVDERDTVAQAVLLSGGRIAAVGTEEAVRNAASGTSVVVDVGGSHGGARIHRQPQSPQRGGLRPGGRGLLDASQKYAR